MNREEKIELLKHKLVEYFNKRGIDNNFTYLLAGTKEKGLNEVFNYVCNEIIESRQAIFIFRLIDDVLIYHTETEDEEMKKRLISALIETKDAEYICKCLIRNQYDLDNETIEKLERALVKTNSTKDIINYIQNREDIEDNFISLIIETKNPELIYALAVKLDEENCNINKLVEALIKTDNIEYINLLADYFDTYVIDSHLNQQIYKYLLVEYFKKHGIDSNFTHLLARARPSGLNEVLNDVCNEIIKSKQAVSIFRFIDLCSLYDVQSEKMKKRLISALIETKDAEYIYKSLVSHRYGLDSETIEKLEQALIKTNSTKEIVCCIQNHHWFTDSFISLIIETKNPELIYTLAVNFNIVNEDAYNKLVKALIETDNIEYIKALADYFNNFVANSQLNQKIYDYLNAYLPYVEGADKAKLMNIRNEYESDIFERNEDSETIEKIIDAN